MLIGSLKFAIGFVGATLLFWLGLAYDRLPAGWPNSEVKCCLVVHFSFHMPGAGAVTAGKVDADRLRAQLRTCAASVSTLKGALATQNAAVAATAATGERMSLAAQSAVQRARAAHMADLATAARILAEPAPVGEDELATCRRADHYLLEGAQ